MAKIYTVNNVTILGTKIQSVITGVIIQGKLTEDDFAVLAMAKLKGKLQTQHVGSVSGFGERDLDPNEKLQMGIVNMQLNTAQEQKDTYLVEQVFGDLRKKS